MRGSRPRRRSSASTTPSRGDRQTASSLVDDDLRAGPLSTLFGDPDATFHYLRIEEIRLIDTGVDYRARATTEQTVYLRASLALPGASWADPGPLALRRTFAGTWRVRPDGDRWRLVAAQLRGTVSLATLADGLPGGTSILQTASGDLRGQRIEDQAVLASSPGRFSLAEPYVLFGDEDGDLAPAVPLASFVRETLAGGPAASC